MTIEEFKRIKETINEEKYVAKENFKGLISINQREKRKIFRGSDGEMTLNEIIAHEVEKRDKDFLSFKTIKEIILDLAEGEDLVSETTMTDRFMKFMEMIGGKSWYALNDKNRFMYHKNQVPIVIFLLIELSTSNTLLNMYTTKSREKIIYKDIDIFFKKLGNFLTDYVESKEVKERVYATFVWYFKYDLLKSYLLISRKMDELYAEIDKYEEIEYGEINKRYIRTLDLNRDLGKFIENTKEKVKEEIREESLYNQSREEEKENVYSRFDFLRSLGH